MIVMRDLESANMTVVRSLSSLPYGNQITIILVGRWNLTTSLVSQMSGVSAVKLEVYASRGHLNARAQKNASQTTSMAPTEQTTISVSQCGTVAGTDYWTAGVKPPVWRLERLSWIAWQSRWRLHSTIFSKSNKTEALQCTGDVTLEAMYVCVWTANNV